MEDLGLFALFVGCLMVFLLTGVPVAAAMGLVGIIGALVFISPAILAQLGNIAFSQSSSFVVTVVPVFILMGEILSSTRIGADLFRAAQLCLHRLPGALAMATVFACSAFAAVCGSSPVTAATIGGMAVPQMIKQGYGLRLALGATAAGGTLGILIPPSIPLILYGVIAETSIGDLFLAGILPGIMIAILLVLTVLVWALLRPSDTPSQALALPWRERASAVFSVFPVAILSLAVLGSIYLGIATPTEAGSIGAAGALLIAAAMGQLGWRTMRGALDNTVRTTAMFLLLLIGGLFSSFVLARIGITQGVSTAVLALDVPSWAIILLINLLLFVLGMFMDPLSILVIIVPVFLPAVIEMGYDPVWFGVLVTINIEIAAVTPPVGFNLFVLKAVVPQARITDVIAGSLIFVVPLVLGLAILILFPEIALLLPSLAH